MRCRRYTVTINRWDIYRVYDVVASTAAEAEEKALELYENGADRCEHADGGVNSLSAEPDEE